LNGIEPSPAFMAFEKILQPPFFGRGSDQQAVVIFISQRPLFVTICLAHQELDEAVRYRER
jgi:hypothetical protein